MDITSATKGTSFQADRTKAFVGDVSKEELVTQPAKETTTPTDPEYDGNITLQTYMAFLKEHDVTDADINAVLWRIITSGSVEWGCTLFDRVKVRFRMRPAWVENLISEDIDRVTTITPNISVMHFSNIVRMSNLAGSLVQYGDRMFKMENRNDYDESYDYVSKMPYPLVAKICEQLAVFDRVIAVAMSDWAMKNFTETPKENS